MIRTGRIKKAVAAVVLAASILLLSAFSFKQNGLVTRFVLAQVLNQILVDAIPNLALEAKGFPDLDFKQSSQISAVTGLGIMGSFASGEFCPESEIRNHEVLHYLHRTWLVLRANVPASTVTLKLAKIVGLGRHDFFRNRTSSYSLFSESSQSSDQAELETIVRIRRILEMEKETGKIYISITDSQRKIPVRNAFVAINSHAYAVEDSGKLIVSGIKQDSYEVLVSAPGYHSLRLKRNLLQNSKLNLKLRPLHGKILVKALEREKMKQIERFSVRFGDEIHNTENGEILVKPPVSGYYDLEVMVSGKKNWQKKVFADKDVVELTALF